MAKVYCVSEVAAFAPHIELEGATPIRPLEAVVIQFGAPQATDEWEIPSAPLSIAVLPEQALERAIALYQATTARR